MVEVEGKDWILESDGNEWNVNLVFGVVEFFNG